MFWTRLKNYQVRIFNISTHYFAPNLLIHAVFYPLAANSGPRVPRHVGEGFVGGVSGFASKFMYGLSHLVVSKNDFVY